MRPATNQAGAHILQLGKLDLQLSLVAARTLGENFKDEQRAVVDRQLDVAFQVALLGRAQGLVKQHLHRAMHLGQRANLIGLSAAHKQRRIRGLALAGNAGHRLHASGLCQQTQLLQLTVEVGQTKVHPHQQYRSGACLKGRSRTQSGPPFCTT